MGTGYITLMFLLQTGVQKARTGHKEFKSNLIPAKISLSDPGGVDCLLAHSKSIFPLVTCRPWLVESRFIFNY